MKTKSLLLLSSLVLTNLLYSCSQKQEKDVKDLMVQKSTICYQAVSEKDTG